jgi:ubiquinone/menaquinone biosynthesis C-methylase UbiE
VKLSEIEKREIDERTIHKDDKIVLNYTGQFKDFGDTLEDGTIIDHGKLWEFLTRYRMLIKLANVTDINGKCIIRQDAVKYDTALELGCDWGHCFDAIHSGFIEVYGIEVMKSSVELGNRLGRNVQYGIMEDLPYSNKVFDIVISNHVLEHSTDILKTVKEIKRVTKHNGWGLHTLPLDVDGSKLVVGGFHNVHLSAKEFIELFSNNGFNLVNSFYLWNHDKEDFTIILRRNSDV